MAEKLTRPARRLKRRALPAAAVPAAATGYRGWLARKAQAQAPAGIPTAGLAFTQALKPFQLHIVKLALAAGRYALFEDCGLGKTLQQLEWARHIVAYTGRPVLVLTPLAVVAQTIDEGAKFGIDVWRLQPEFSVAGALAPGIFVTNYEQVENLDPNAFVGVVLDESSILKNFTGATKKLLLNYFLDTPYKLCCTATPSPNDWMELGNHAEFLGVMSRATMLATYFTHDGGDTSKWRLKGHAQDKFWAWVASWACCLASPADLGFDATGYQLPPLELLEQVVEVPGEPTGGSLFTDDAVSATQFSQALRESLEPRMQMAAALALAEPDEPFLIWIDLNEEGEYLRRLLPEAMEVKGSDSPEVKAARLLGFARGEFRVLITKRSIASFGLNYQHCARQVATADFGFEKLYQGVRRSYRFGQLRTVRVWLLSTRRMGNVLPTLRRKQAQHEQLHAALSAAISAHQTPDTHSVDTPASQVVRGRDFTFYLGDCCEQLANVADKSVHFSIFSPPFADLYTYSGLSADMGNSASYDEFRQHFAYLVPELARVMVPGRNVAVHCMDLPIQKGKEGFIGLRDFSGLLIEAFQAQGFIYHDRITIWKDPVVEMQRTKSLGLLHKQLKKDSAMSRTGIPDYLLVFRAPGENPVPIRQDVSVDTWQKWASPVWMDIKYGRTLQREPAREAADEKHICPLQLDTIERGIALWSNQGETVLTPFGGIGSEGYQAVKMGRKAILIELKESYWRIGCRNLRDAEAGKLQLSVFDLLSGVGQPAAVEECAGEGLAA